jgi:hypothetical protein
VQAAFILNLCCSSEREKFVKTWQNETDVRAEFIDPQQAASNKATRQRLQPDTACSAVSGRSTAVSSAPMAVKSVPANSLKSMRLAADPDAMRERLCHL